MTPGLAYPELRLGQRVRHGTELGVVTEIIKRGTRRTYMVHWDGRDHDSGEYGVTALVPAASPDSETNDQEANGG